MRHYVATTKEHFNGKFEVDIPAAEKAAIDRHSTAMFGRELAPYEWGELIGSPDGERLECRNLPTSIIVQKRTDSDATSAFTSLIREVRRGSQYGAESENAVHLYAAVISRKPGSVKAMAPRMVYYSAKKCHELGIKSIVSQAEGNKHTSRTSIGYRYWPKLGFNADITATDRVKLPPRYRSAKTVLDLHEMEDGEKVWREIGSQRKMVFDTTPGSRSQKVLEAYLKQKGITT